MQEQKNELRGDSRTVSLDSGTLSRKVSNYERLFLQPVKTAALHGKAIYVRPEFHQRIQRIVRLLDNDKISMYSYLDRVLEHHFATFDEEITVWCRNRIQTLSRDLKTTLPCAPYRRTGAMAGQPAGLPAAEYLQTDVADPSRQRIALLYADQPQDLLPGRRCAVVPCGAGSAAQARTEAQKRSINGGVRIAILVVVSGRISHQTDGKWAMN